MKYQRGFSVIESMFAMVFLVAAIAWAGAWQLKQSETAQQLQAAEHLKLVADAAGKYIADNYAAVLAVAGPVTPATITPSMLTSTGYLPNGFSAVNTYAQTYEVKVIQPTAGMLQALVISVGGTKISEVGIRKIAQIVGAKGGFVSSQDTSNIQGSFGGWVTPLAGFSISPEDGHVGVALFVEDAVVVNDYLHRNRVSGKPELNHMDVNLDMQENDINSRGDINASGVFSDQAEVSEAKIDSVETTGGLKLSYTNTAMGSCSKNGLVSKANDGSILSCVSGKWTKYSLGNEPKTYIFQAGHKTHYEIPGGYNNNVCFISSFKSFSFKHSDENSSNVECRIYKANGMHYLYAHRWTFIWYDDLFCSATCI